MVFLVLQGLSYLATQKLGVEPHRRGDPRSTAQLHPWQLLQVKANLLMGFFNLLVGEGAFRIAVPQSIGLAALALSQLRAAVAVNQFSML